MARRSTPPASPQRPSLACHRSEVDRLLTAQIQAGKDIQQKYVGSHLYLVSNKMWRSDYKKQIDGWKEYNLEFLRVIFTNDQIANDYDAPADALLGGDIEKDDR